MDFVILKKKKKKVQGRNSSVKHKLFQSLGKKKKLFKVQGQKQTSCKI